MFKYFIIILILGFSPINWACNQAMETENGKAKHVNLPPALQLYLDSERFISSEVYQTSYFYLFTTLNNLPVKRLNTNPIKNWFKSWLEDESKNFQAFELENLKAKLYAQKQILKDGTNHLFLTVNDLAYKSNGNALKDAKPYKGYSEALGQLVAAVANFIRDMQLSNQHDFKSFEIKISTVNKKLYETLLKRGFEGHETRFIESSDVIIPSYSLWVLRLSAPL